jgi:hypothetical protein
MSRSEFAEENGGYGRCVVCRRKIWIESGCAPLCDGCHYEDEDNPPQEPDTLANLGLSEADFR